ncbi:hypothetical protein IV203_011615 [Nitzschia inconspicua]|uniref:Uncharacterized protein n=1 Tax=Nitzschia inconspicua TaxID=303405 RepID=A0A9K3PIU0_9STRA|nr:hypothetical protein IV203_011615 [Nitzschia inconspicua]
MRRTSTSIRYSWVLVMTTAVLRASTSRACAFVLCHAMYVQRPHCSGSQYQSMPMAQGVSSKEGSLLSALSDAYLENDLVSVRVPSRLLVSNPTISQKDDGRRFCVVRPDATVVPLCRHEDDVETDLFIDPRTLNDKFWQDITDDLIDKTYGEGWYGQRPVPFLGGGPGYGAEADEIWSIDEPILSQLEDDGVELPVLNVGIAHGEKARGGAY